MARSLVPPHIAALKPYVPGKPIEELERELGITGAIKLASNENPLGPSPKAVEAMQAAAAHAHIYPDGAAYKFKEAVAEYATCSLDEIAIGNGSNELLTLLVRTFALAGDHAVISDHSFVAYRVIMGAEGLHWTSVPTLPGYRTDVDAMIDAVRPGETRLVFIANPNNPTGTSLGTAEVTRLLHEIPPEVIVVLDEAYHEYVQREDYETGLRLRDVRERLVITRSFSKVYGLGGARAGFAVGPAEMMDYLNRVREPFNCNAMVQAGAAAALTDFDFVRRSVEVNEQGRAQLEAGLAALSEQGVTWTPSDTNFLLIETPHEGRAVYDGMLRQGVIVRPMVGYGLPNSLRVTIGTEAECTRALAALAHVLEGL